MKRQLAGLLAAIIFIMSAACVSAAGYTDTLRVGLAFGSTAVTNAVFSSADEIYIFAEEGHSFLATIPPDTTVNFIMTENSTITVDGYLSEYAGNLLLESGGIISYKSSQYRGSFELRNNGDGKITVINIVNTEDYLAGVLGKEMSSSWPIEALKAQAICARNYAVSNVNKHSSYGFDICATVDCQVYGGISGEGEKTRQAVAETKGILVTYNGRVVPLVYFSCDGGYTEDSENVWANEEGYLRGKKDIYENSEYVPEGYSSWSVTMTKAEVEETLKKKNIDVGELLDILIDETSDNNGVVSMTFVGTDGKKTVTKTSARTTLSLKSQAFTIEKEGEEPQYTTEQVHPIDMVESAMYVLTNEGISAIGKEDVYVLTENGVEKIIAEEIPEDEEEIKGYDAYTFNGNGWGHLVGMSQWGAYSMAKLNMTYEDILNFYYTDIKITKG